MDGASLLTILGSIGATSTVAYGAWLGGMAISAHTRLTKIEDRLKTQEER